MYNSLRWQRRIGRALIALSVSVLAAGASAQFEAGGMFSSARPDTAWSLSGAAMRTAPSIDPEGSGWLRLTGNQAAAQGRALQASGSFSAANGVTLSLGYVAWGGGKPGADGIVMFLYDASGDMAGAGSGGGLGYCSGAGAYLGVALDEYGNFSNPADWCSAGGGPGWVPQALSIRGPTASGNPFITVTALPGGVDDPAAQSRPQIRQVVVVLTPKAAGPGFLINVHLRSAASGAWTQLIAQADFPYAPPAALRVGVAGSTGGAKNIHEIQYLTVAGNAPELPAIRQRFEPAQVPLGGTSSLVFEFRGNGASSATLVAPIIHRLPAGMTVAEPLVLGGDCPGAISATAGGNTIVIATGTVVRAAGCTLSVDVRADVQSTLTSTLGAGVLRTDRGSNTLPVSAVLTVAPSRR